MNKHEPIRVAVGCVESPRETVEEERVSALTVECSIQDSVILYYNYSDLSKLLRVIAYVLRFKYKTRRGECSNRIDCILTMSGLPRKMNFFGVVYINCPKDGKYV